MVPYVESGTTAISWNWPDALISTDVWHYVVTESHYPKTRWEARQRRGQRPKWFTAPDGGHIEALPRPRESGLVRRPTYRAPSGLRRCAIDAKRVQRQARLAAWRQA